MFSVTVDNVEYKVEFRHRNPAKFGWPYPGTWCFIYKVIDEEVVEHTTRNTDLHPNDYNSYSKNFGRRESLARALRGAFYGEENKETRRKFWQAYYEVRGEKW